MTNQDIENGMANDGLVPTNDGSTAAANDTAKSGIHLRWTRICKSVGVVNGVQTKPVSGVGFVVKLLLFLGVYASCGVEGSENVHFSWRLHSLMCDEMRGALWSTLVFEVEMQFTGCCLIDSTCSPGILLE